MANKMAVRAAHFFIGVIAGFLVGYCFYTFRPNADFYEAVGAGVVTMIIAFFLLPRLHRSGGGGGD